MDTSNQQVLSTSAQSPVVVPPYKFILPPIENAQTFLAEKREEPPQVIRGVLRKGAKCILAAPAKAHKSWNLIACAISVSAGEPWLGMETTQGRVLYINMELLDYDLRNRIDEIASALGIDDLSNLDVWNLRGKGTHINVITNELQHYKDKAYSLICVDPIYKLMGGADEISAKEVSAICAYLDTLAVKANAAIMYATHFSKSRNSEQYSASFEKISGSGVWGRDADAIITLNRKGKEHIYQVEMTLRSFAEPTPFHIKWEHPIMVPASPAEAILGLKKPSGRKPKYSDEDILAPLKEAPLASGEWHKKVEAKTGMSEDGFNKRIPKLEEAGCIHKNEVGKWCLNASATMPLPQETDTKEHGTPTLP